MFRRFLLAALVAVTALVACTSAFADPNSDPVVTQTANFHAMPCLGAGHGFAGLMTSTFTVKSAKGHGYTTLNGNVRAGLLFAYQANDPADPSYIGVQLVSQPISVPVTSPADVTSVDLPITVPVIGSDGSVSAVTTTATATFTPANGHNYDGVLEIGGDFDCVDNALQPAVAPIPADTQSALVDLINSASQAGASGAIANGIAQDASVRSFGLLSAALTSPNAAKLVDSMLASPWIVMPLKGLTHLFDALNAQAAASAQ